MNVSHVPFVHPSFIPPFHASFLSCNFIGRILHPLVIYSVVR